MMKKAIKRNVIQIFAIAERNVKIKLRFKLNLAISYITPMMGVILPFIIMGKLFNYNDHFGPWTSANILIFQFMAYNINLLRNNISAFPRVFYQEKYWQTLPALIIAPFRRINILFGIFFTNLILISIPFGFFFIMCYFIYPVLPLTFLFILSLYLFIALIFSGIGIIIGVLAISKEGFTGIINFILSLFFWFSCLSYPFYVFPEVIQNIVALNPLYHIFDILRVSWVENNIILTIESHLFSFLIIVLGAVFIPLIGVIIFNKIYRKYGIVGY